MRALAVAVLLSVGLSGCFQSGDPARAPAPSVAPDLPEPFVWEGQGCQALLLATFPEYSVTATWLPRGFAPADPNTFLNTEVPVGRALFLVGFLECPDGSVHGRADFAHATASFLVEPPTGHPAPPGVFDFYDVSHSAQDWLWREMTRRGWRVDDAPISLGADFGIDAQMTASYAEENASGVVYVLVAPPFERIDLRGSRFWRLEGDLLHELSLEFEQKPIIGPAGCAFDAASVPGQVIGRIQAGRDDINCDTTAAPPVGAHLPGMDFRATLRTYEAPI